MLPCPGWTASIIVSPESGPSGALSRHHAKYGSGNDGARTQTHRNLVAANRTARLGRTRARARRGCARRDDRARACTPKRRRRRRLLAETDRVRRVQRPLRLDLERFTRGVDVGRVEDVRELDGVARARRNRAAWRAQRVRGQRARLVGDVRDSRNDRERAFIRRSCARHGG